MKYYNVAEYDGLGQLSFESVWTETECRAFCALHEEEFDPDGGGFQHSWYQAGPTSERSTGFEYMPADF